MGAQVWRRVKSVFACALPPNTPEISGVFPGISLKVSHRSYALSMFEAMKRIAQNEHNCSLFRRVGPAGARVLARMLLPEDGGYRWVSAYQLHRETGVPYPSVWLILKALEGCQQNKYVEKQPGVGAGRRKKWLYRLTEEGARCALQAVDRVLTKVHAPKPTSSVSGPTSAAAH